MQRFLIERSKDEFYTALSGLALVGLFLNRYCNLVSKLDNAASVSSIGIKSSDVIKAFIGLVCIGKTVLRSTYSRHSMLGLLMGNSQPHGRRSWPLAAEGLARPGNEI